MENHLERMQADVDAMEQMFSTPEVDTTPPAEEAHVEPTDTLDSMIDNMDEVKEGVEEVDKEEVSKKTKRTNWKSRYTKYRQTTDATIFELRKENSNLISQIQSLSKRVDEMRESAIDTTSFTDRFTDVDKEILGEDAISSIEAATDAAVQPLKQQLADEKKWREDQLELQRAKSKSQADTYFLTALATAVPEYAEINVDPAFEAWMNGSDSVSGIPRVRLFKQAQAAGDVSRVAGFMKEYQEVNKPIDNLKDKVTPVSTPSASPTYDQGDKLSMDTVQKFYDDVLKGKYRSNEKARLEMDAKINKALDDRNVY